MSNWTRLGIPEEVQDHVAAARDSLTTLYVFITAMERGEAVPPAALREAVHGVDTVFLKAMGLHAGDSMNLMDLPEWDDDADELN